MYQMRNSIKAIGAVTLLLVLAGCAPTAPAEPSGGAAPVSGGTSSAVDADVDVTALCGDEDIQVALADGTGGNTWRQISRAEFEKEAAKCSNITDIYYSNANGDPQKAAADISGFVTQGVDVLVMLPDFGVSQLPSMREAQQAGVAVVPYFAAIEGTPGVDFSDNVALDNYQAGLDMGAWYGENIESGNIVMLGGYASCPSCETMFEGLKAGLEPYPDLTLIGEGFIATDYSPEIAERAVAGLITQYGDIVGLASDLGTTAMAGVNAFESAGLPSPALTVLSGSNSAYCYWQEQDAAGNTFPYGGWETTTQLVTEALRRGLANFNGIEYGGPLTVPMPLVIDTPAGEYPPCDPAMPADADMFSNLTDEELLAVFD